MPIFRRRKKEEEKPVDKKLSEIPEDVQEEIKKIKDAVEGERVPSLPVPESGLEVETKLEQEKQTEIKREIEKRQPEYAPLFVKIERYKDILNTLNEIKAGLIAIRDVVSLSNELQRLMIDMTKMLNSTVNKVDTKIIELDEEFLRPKGYEEELPQPMTPDVENLGVVVDDLKSKIERLKSEIDTNLHKND